MQDINEKESVQTKDSWIQFNEEDLRQDWMSSGQDTEQSFESFCDDKWEAMQ